MGRAGSSERLHAAEQRRYIADLFARIAPRYDVMNTLMTGGLHRRWRGAAARIATLGLEGIALDVATGTGDLALVLARRPGNTGAVGLDLLPQMVVRARAKSRKKGLNRAVGFLVGDSLSLPFPDGEFACATTAWGLRNMPDVRVALEEMVRVVRPGGRVVSLESMPLERGPFRHILRFGFLHVVPLMGQLVAGDRAAYTYLPRSVDRFLTVDGLEKLFHEVGLLDVGYRKMGLGMVALHWGTVPP